VTLTVRLDETLESALERYCAETGVTKSRVVQQSLAAYLLASQPADAKTRGARAGKAQVSANYRAFEKAGLIGAVALGGGSADKAGVRERVARSFAERKARRDGM
jgi:predicted transcriptional regulator